MLRTHTCGELSQKNIGEKVTLSGWVHRRRDHGGVIFIDLRDRYGVTQIKFDPDTDACVHVDADALRSEWVIQVKGEVIGRPKDMINEKISTGEIEIVVNQLIVLNKSKTPPFEIGDEKVAEAGEHIRLKYRYVDLRRKKIQELLQQKDEFIKDMRAFFHARNFQEVQTPLLANSSPEGARDWLVPSRLYNGKFYALPQAPQQFKQLLMVGGIDRYFQIAPCFRDEDPRMDRHFGEFYQLDFEMSFVEQEDIFALMQELWIDLTEKHSDKEIVNKEFPQITWKDAMNKYGTDKPDLRFDLKIKNISEIVTECEFGVFTNAIENGGVVHALKVDDGSQFSRKDIDDLTNLAGTKGAKGLAYIIVKDDGELQSPIVKFLGEDVSSKIISTVNARPGDIVFFGADQWRIVCESLGVVRDKCGEMLGFKDDAKAAWVWIIDFPMYDYSEIEEGKIDFSHNPFSMPQGGMKSLKEDNPLEIVAYQFDLILNGFEISSGAIRNHDPEIMYKAFEIAGYTKKQVKERFGHMINAFEYGAPPHGGSAPGIDRAFMVLKNCNSIRDIYAFPKDGQGRDVMMDSPSFVDQAQLDELGLKIID
ncbi:MAG: aspartate--tRNA ligase [Candidatus Moraniibacteriota bacterium]|nr:MAG: aspartate--tRNA ligase [Candidatus Moranbacteria bacterium]